MIELCQVAKSTPKRQNQLEKMKCLVHLKCLGINHKTYILPIEPLHRTLPRCQEVPPPSGTMKQQYGCFRKRTEWKKEKERFIPCFLSQLLISDSAGATMISTQSQLDILEDYYKSNYGSHTTIPQCLHIETVQYH